MYLTLLRHSRVLLVCAPLWACMGFGDAGAPKLTATALRGGVTLEPVATGGLEGLSDLTATADGAGSVQLWALPEQQRFLAPLDLRDPAHPALGPSVRPIVGIPRELDTESITSLGAGRFAVGTESMVAGRDGDAIFVVANDGNNGDAATPRPLAVVQALVMPYRLWPGFRAAANEGIEGLCHAGGQLLASSESRGQLADGAHFAPLGRYDLGADTWQPMALRLTLPSGRISALQCRIVPERPDVIELLAIERHFGVGRLLHAWVPRHAGVEEPAPAVIVPTVVADLPTLLGPIVNFEGVVWLPGHRVALLTDNHMMCVRGETYLLTLPEGGL